MLERFPCPICGSERWVELGRFQHTASAEQPFDYLALRKRVLFEVWFPGSKSVTLVTLGCKQCGFACYSPRPEAADIAAKYEFLGLFEPEVAVSEDAASVHADRKRADMVYAALADRLPEHARIVDIGGGDGRVLLPFIEHGHEGYVLDYKAQVLPGVSRLGSTLDDLHPDELFDAAILSHVLEHVADPVEMLRQTASHLEAAGCVYVEVPSQVWRRVPISRDAVTHVNFFVRASLEQALCEAGLRPLVVKVRPGSYGTGRMEVIAAVAMIGDAQAPQGGWRELHGRLHPSRLMRARRAFRDRVVRRGR